MSEALRYEKLETQFRALARRLQRIEYAFKGNITEKAALKAWEKILRDIHVKSLERCWRDIETHDLHACMFGTSQAALEKMRSSLSANAWKDMKEALRLPYIAYSAHESRVTVLGIVRELEEMGEIVQVGPGSRTKYAKIVRQREKREAGERKWVAEVLGAVG